MAHDIVWHEFADRRRAGMIHALDGGLWFHRHMWRGERMAHLVSSDRGLLLAAGRALGLPARGLQYKPLKDPRTGVRVEAWHWDLRGPYFLRAANMLQPPAGNGSERSSHIPNVDRRSKAADGMRVSVIVLASSLALLGCNEEGIFSDDDLAGTSGRILASDTTLLQEEAVTYNVLVEYPFGSGAPREFAWSSSDTLVVSIQGVFTNGTVSAIARAPGTALLTVLLNERFHDTVAIDVVAPGTVRWQQSLGGEPHTPALDTVGNVYVIERGATTATLRAFTPSGSPLFDVASCYGSLSPAVNEVGVSYATGTDCTRRHDATGALLWSADLGGFEGGAALASDGGAVVAYSVGTGGAGGAIVVSRFAALGVETWRDTLDTEPLAQKGAPAVAFNGDIYVPWRAAGGGDSLTRLLGNGTVRWTVALPDWPRYTTPAPREDRVYVAYLGGLMALDSATGNVIWDRKFNAANPGAASDEPPSSPVYDAVGNVYVQTANGLHSYTEAGVSRWVADTLGYGTTAGAVGAPTLLLNGSLVVVCGGEICAVRSSDGSRVWRSAVGGGLVGTPAVNEIGTLIVARASPAQVVALWGRALPILSSWSTEGGDMGRSRRERL